MAYGKDDFVFDGLDDYDFSDFSDFSDDDTGRVSESDPSWSDSDDDIRQFCICGGPMTKEMIGCDTATARTVPLNGGTTNCAGMTEETIPEGDWLCPSCLQAEQQSMLSGKIFGTAIVKA